MRELTRAEAESLAARTDFAWWQRFELGSGVHSPGPNDMGWLFEQGAVPRRLDGQSVLDIGTANGAAAFLAERRGARRVVGVDIYDDATFGFGHIKEALGSSAEFLQASIYELPELLDEQFDVVLFLGVLYHLRHPLLALDNLRRLTSGTAIIETAVCDAELVPGHQGVLCKFHREGELNDDPSNWFSPSVACLLEWCRSSGLDPVSHRSWPEPAPQRCIAQVRPVEGPPEYVRLSYEVPLRARVDRSELTPDRG